MSENKPLLQATDEEAPAPVKSKGLGFDDGFTEWGNTLQAFKQVGYHSAIYMILGIVFYSYILETKLTVIQSIYFSVSVFTTVGYGDISPASSIGGMLFTCIYGLYGIIILGLFLGILGDYVVRKEQAIVAELTKAAKESYMKSLHDEVDGGEQELPSAFSEHSGPLYDFVCQYSVFFADLCVITIGQRAFIFLVLLLGLPILVAEKWSIVPALYWLVMTGTTIGLGDLHPTTPFSQFYCIGYIPFTVILTGKILGNIADKYVAKKNHEKQGEFFSRCLDASSLDKMDTNDDASVSKIEFLIFMLKTIDKIDDSDVKEILGLFDKLDKDGSGVLNKMDLGFIQRKSSKIVKKVSANKKKRRTSIFSAD